MSSFHIRPATAADIPVLMSLERGADTASHWSEEQYNLVFSQNSKRNVLTIENAGTIFGFVVLHAIAPDWEVENIVVTNSARRKGLGMQLLRESLNLACHHGAQEIFLEVRDSNLAARALYETSGFKQCGRRKGYYQNPCEDAIRYRCSC
jgi:[ribosomal protein S18]-alanine N-acetyltransferase